MAKNAAAPWCVLLLLLGLYLGAYRTAVKAQARAGNLLGKTTVPHKDRQALREIYTAEIDVREATGQNDGARVEEYLTYCRLGAGHAWCAAFVSWCFGEAGYAQPRNPWSPALFPAGRVVWRSADAWNGAYVGQHGVPKTGDVFGIYYPALKRIAHVGFIDQLEGQWAITVEGNADDRVRRKRRNLQSIHAVADWLSQATTD